MSRAMVIGGGVIGLSVAWELAQRGADVAIYDRDKIGRATSWAASGILPPANSATAIDPIDRLRGLSTDRMPAWVDQIQRLSGIDVGLNECGGWYLADTAGERASMLGMADYWNDREICCEAVPLTSVAEQEPGLDPWARQHPDAAAWWVPQECQIRPPRLLQALAAVCRGRGVALYEDCDVELVRTLDGHSMAMVGGAAIEAETIVVCGGAWTGQIAAEFGLGSSVIPVRGQIELLKAERPLLNSIINVGNRYVVCRDDGHTIVGSCEEEVGFDLRTTESMIDSLHQFAIQYVPALTAAKRVRAWSGLRPMTFDGFPMIGRVPEIGNLYVATGHYRSGIHLSTATAICLADLIDGREAPIDLEAFRLAKELHD